MERSSRSSGVQKKAKSTTPVKVSSTCCYLFTILVAVSILSFMFYALNQQQADLKQKRGQLSLPTTPIPVVLSQPIRAVASIIPTFSPTAVSTVEATLISTTKDKNANNNGKKPGKKPGRKPKDPYDFVVQIDPQWGMKGEYPYIKMLPTLKMDIKKDRRVIFTNITINYPERSSDPATGIVGNPRELVKANEILMRHPLHQLDHSDKELEDVMYYVQKSQYCHQKPIFLSMATVHDDLYWQLIENFVYTMVKFGVSDCSLVICVSDPKCMKMCEEAHFPCYNYVEHKLPLPSVMEQIAAVKLFHVPKALNRGVDVFMLDLDVGFLDDPNYMVKAFVETPIVDILVQEDYIFIMNRTKAGWKQWFTEPLPNIGLFLCRGNNKTAKVFEIAWGKYLKMDDPIEKSMPGKDQNHVLDAMRIGRANFGLKYAYFDNYTAPLLDKLVMNYGNVMELGGDLMGQFLHKSKSIAMHTTCYEKSTKVMGLKATNSFWNPRYYDPLRPTITKQILFTDEKQLLDEVRSLVWLAITTERSLIIPNILGTQKFGAIAPYNGQVMWPGFRVILLKRNKGMNQLKVQILEPAYYWRVERDYDPVPEPHVLYFDPETETLQDIKEQIFAQKHQPRIVLHPLRKPGNDASPADLGKINAAMQSIAKEVTAWANDSVGYYSQPYQKLIRKYQQIPSVKMIRDDPLASEVLQGMRNCAKIFGPNNGNRTCFQICD